MGQRWLFKDCMSWRDDLRRREDRFQGPTSTYPRNQFSRRRRHSDLKIGVRGTFCAQAYAFLNMIVLALKSFFTFKYTSCLAST